jgi:hypothetical protein
VPRGLPITVQILLCRWPASLSSCFPQEEQDIWKEKKKKREGRKRGKELRVNLEIAIWLPQLPWSLWQATQPPTRKLCQCPHLQHVNNTSLKAYQHPALCISLLLLHVWPAKVRRKARDFTRSEKITVNTIWTIIHCEWSNARMTFKWDHLSLAIRKSHKRTICGMS